MTLSSFRPRRMFCMSAWMASAMPGYCTLTATIRPSSSRARWTWPIDAAAIGSGSKSAKTSLELPAEVVLDHRRDRLERHGLGVLLERREDLLPLRPDVLGHEAEVDRRQRLADLHRRARMPANILTSPCAALSCCGSPPPVAPRRVCSAPGLPRRHPGGHAGDLDRAARTGRAHLVLARHVPNATSVEGVQTDRREPTIEELAGLVSYAERRVALYRRKVYAGGGNPSRLAELERVLAGATARLARAQDRA